LYQALSVGKQQLYFSCIGFVNNVRSAQCPFALCRFFCQDVAGVGLSVDNFTGARFFKSLCRRSVCFYFRHINYSPFPVQGVACFFNHTNMYGVKFRVKRHATSA